MEVDDVSSDIVFSGVSEQLQLRPVGPQDNAVAGDQMPAYCRVLEKILGLVGRLVQGRRILEAIDRADDAAVLVPNRLDVDHGPDGRAVRPLELALRSSNRNAGAQHARHWG